MTFEGARQDQCILARRCRKEGQQAISELIAQSPANYQSTTCMPKSAIPSRYSRTLRELLTTLRFSESPLGRHASTLQSVDLKP